MSIFGSIMDAIFGKSAEAAPAQGQSGGGIEVPTMPGVTGSGAAEVDVEQILNDLAAKSKQKLNWRKSIVDLMKLLDLDSSLKARKELAEELGYSGDMHDSAKMNIWLHKQVMNKLAENGGKVPDDLKD